MNVGQAAVWLARTAAADQFPTLDGADLYGILDDAKRADSNGIAPSGATWVPTWDLATAARDAWRVKAGRATAAYDFTTDGQMFSRSEVHKMCMAMADEWRGRVLSSSTVTPSWINLATSVVQ